MRSRSFLLLFLILSIYMPVGSFAQTTTVVNPDSRLYQCFDSTYIQQIQSTNQALLAYYNFYLDNAYYTASLTQPKPITGEDINKVTIVKNISGNKTTYFSEKTYNAATFNVLKYNFKTQDANFTTYLWKEANIALVFLPRNKIASAFKEYCTKNNIASK